MTPFTPMDVPTRNFVNGKMKNSKMMKGTDLITLTTKLMSWFNHLFSIDCPVRVNTSKIPKGTPIRVASKSDIPTI